MARELFSISLAFEYFPILDTVTFEWSSYRIQTNQATRIRLRAMEEDGHDADGLPFALPKW